MQTTRLEAQEFASRVTARFDQKKRTIHLCFLLNFAFSFFEAIAGSPTAGEALVEKPLTSPDINMANIMSLFDQHGKSDIYVQRESGTRSAIRREIILTVCENKSSSPLTIAGFVFSSSTFEIRQHRNLHSRTPGRGAHKADFAAEPLCPRHHGLNAQARQFASAIWDTTTVVLNDK
jgi:hypothetical protein